MEGNKDESEKCIALAKKYIREGDVEKGLKWLKKADQMFPSKEAKDLIASTENTGSSAPNGNAKRTNGEASRPSSKQSTPSRDEPRKTPASNGPRSDFTSEQLEAVKKINKCKNYYEILGITKEATEADLKKQYRKLALQFHPDKNQAPGASEAFKAIGTAFAVLSDKEKRRQYDLYGTEDEQRASHRSPSNHHREEYHRGFEQDISAEEIFNMFFGGGFPTGNVYVRRGNRWQEAQHQRQQATHNNETNASGYSVLLQMMPVLVLVLLSLMSSLFVSEPAFSLAKTSKYINERKTTNLEVPYYVKENFEKDYRGSIRRVEAQVEEEFITNLRGACFRERNYKENMIWRARNFRDPGLEEKAKSLKTPSCDHLSKLSREYSIWS
ncbi:DnaJ -like protein subfamily B member 12 [Halotydeus destructor]|nr:DnaJ -like protein subfamily B member 12 [Halotydeus destructor]